MGNLSVGSICSGIEAASIAWDTGYNFKWFSEVAEFPSRLLSHEYPSIPNLGDMIGIPHQLRQGEASSVDIICGGTPCQAFSLAGWKRGLQDDRGNLTLSFVDIVDENDRLRVNDGKSKTVVLWENVEGVLRDKTNAFGCFISSLAGLEDELKLKRWPSAGFIHGPGRNVAWRLLDAKFFGLPQQRKRLYVVAGDNDFYPENVLFEKSDELPSPTAYDAPLTFTKKGHSFECFREFTDCLYSAYGTKWNGNAAANNGSLFVCQNGRLRRFTPLECERLMGFPDHYTDLPKARPTNRYQAIGNSWSVPVIRWLGNRLKNQIHSSSVSDDLDGSLLSSTLLMEGSIRSADFSDGIISIKCKGGSYLNASTCPCDFKLGDLKSIVEPCDDERYFITPVGCKGILRRSLERGHNLNTRLRQILEEISSLMSEEEIERLSRKQKRGRFSDALPSPSKEKQTTMLLPFAEKMQ